MFGKNKKDNSEPIKSNTSQYGAGAKYGSVLTMILVVVIVAILGIIGYFAYDIYHQNATNEAAASAISDFEEATKSVRKKTTNTTDDETASPTDEEIQASIDAMKGTETEETETTTEVEKVYYEGYEVVGYISIPKTSCEYPILAEVTKHSLEVAVAVIYGPGVNEVGNTVIMGHNYRNGLFFSNNSKLTIGDKIYITSTTETVTYSIYNMYYTSPDDADYMKRDTEGTREISLSTCNDDSSQRLIIWAREDS